jgi:hypothetical protein
MDISAAGDTATREKLFTKGVYEKGKEPASLFFIQLPNLFLIMPFTIIRKM